MLFKKIQLRRKGQAPDREGRYISNKERAFRHRRNAQNLMRKQFSLKNGQKI